MTDQIAGPPIALRSDEARRALEEITREIGCLDRSSSLDAVQCAALTELLIRRNLLEGVLRGRTIEAERKVVRLERWRAGFASRTGLLRYGYLSGARHGAHRGDRSEPVKERMWPER
ncbi:MAG TPA: hypothetical protein VN668_03515 [Stellaceae bacterium]|nr:hypothetical protein [Stellaceae bacterium]